MLPEYEYLLHVCPCCRAQMMYAARIQVSATSMSVLELSVPLKISVLICNRSQKHIKKKYIKIISNFHNLLGRQTIMLKHSSLGINSLGSCFGMTTYSMVWGKLHKYLWFYLFIHKNNKKFMELYNKQMRQWKACRTKPNK